MERVSHRPAYDAAPARVQAAGTARPEPVSLRLLRTKPVSLDEPRPLPATPEGISDEELIGRARGGDEVAFGDSSAATRRPSIAGWRGPSASRKRRT